jgi:hypothetical protein
MESEVTAQAGPSNLNGNSIGSNISSSKPSSSLFNADEAQFMQESFSSAESFDPFTVGAPGFKVPNTLPANLGGMGSAPNSSTDGVNQAGAAYMTPSNHDQKNLMGLGGVRGGYGTDKAWQMEQLQALQAERFKYMSMQNALPPSQRSLRMASRQQQQQYLQQHQQQFPSILGGDEQLLRAPAVLPDTSNIGHSLGTLSSWPPGEGQQMAMALAMQQQQLQRQQQQQQQQQQQHSGGMDMNGDMAVSMMGAGPSLSSLGAQFPSSHQFPGNDMRNIGYQGMYGQSGVSQQAYANQSQLSQYGHAPSDSMDEGNKSNVGSSSRRTSKAAASAANKASPDPDAPYTFEPAPRPPLPLVDMDRIEAQKVVPSHLHDAFFSPGMKRLQPHLTLLRQEQEKRKAQGLSANIRKGRKDAKQSAKGGDDDSGNGSEDGGAGSAKQKKQAHALLTDAEKKANHIASEQKRRANIRKGYEALCALVPTLRDELGEGGEDDEADEGGAGTNKRGKKRRAVGDEGANAGGERIEGKTGPRSEAMILMKAVEHIRTQVVHHHQLVVRKQQLQRQLAQKMGASQDCFTDGT